MDLDDFLLIVRTGGAVRTAPAKGDALASGGSRGVAWRGGVDDETAFHGREGGPEKSGRARLEGSGEGRGGGGGAKVLGWCDTNEFPVLYSCVLDLIGRREASAGSCYRQLGSQPSKQIGRATAPAVRSAVTRMY